MTTIINFIMLAIGLFLVWAMMYSVRAMRFHIKEAAKFAKTVCEMRETDREFKASLERASKFVNSGRELGDIMEDRMKQINKKTLELRDHVTKMQMLSKTASESLLSAREMEERINKSFAEMKDFAEAQIQFNSGEIYASPYLMENCVYETEDAPGSLLPCNVFYVTINENGEPLATIETNGKIKVIHADSLLLSKEYCKEVYSDDVSEKVLN